MKIENIFCCDVCFLTFGGSVGAGENADLGQSLALAGDPSRLHHRLPTAVRVAPVHGELDVVLLSAELPPSNTQIQFSLMLFGHKNLGILIKK